MVGDRIYTDLAVAQRAGITGVAVLSGESDWSDIKNSGIIPEYVFPSIRELADRSGR
jgi:ribonucleotide monophosphatase NagD (HAD superfamily)